MTLRFGSLAIVGLCAALTLGGCGRKGSLENPSKPTTATAAVDPADAAAPVEPADPQSEKSFFLDFLIK
ncbi:lipoprotein [Roseibium aggregatum]|uniref:Lipoprotein n=1 Tax=Roseibium aggregatum TaxID=187304 RepID=A0A939EHU5_9HYPH|nr:lipoprotein [Roseibium aggregatum]MBN9673233.1 hypothetical protein [Roseibium aggregatum]